MMTNVKQTAKQVQEAAINLAAKYPHGVVPVISIEHPQMAEHKAGAVVEANPYIAARVLVRRTHRLATPEEHEDYKHQQQERADTLRRLELEKKGVATQVVPVSIPAREKPNRGEK